MLSVTFGMSVSGKVSFAKVTVVVLVAPVAITFAGEPEVTAALASVTPLVSVRKRHCEGLCRPEGYGIAAATEPLTASA